MVRTAPNVINRRPIQVNVFMWCDEEVNQKTKQSTMNFLAGYESDDDDNDDDDVKATSDTNDINDDVANDDDGGADDETRGRLERATRKRIKLRNDTADLPDEFFIAKPGENNEEESRAASRPPASVAPVASSSSQVRSLIPPQLARRRANKSTEDDAVQYGSSSKTLHKK
jgi:hypothetical protein